MAKNTYSYKRDFTGVAKNSKGQKFRRVYEEGWKNDGHIIGINETFGSVPKQFLFKGAVAVDYKVEDNKNPKNNKVFKMYSSKGLNVRQNNRHEARMYALSLKNKYEGK